MASRVWRRRRRAVALTTAALSATAVASVAASAVGSLLPPHPGCPPGYRCTLISAGDDGGRGGGGSETPAHDIPAAATAASVGAGVGAPTSPQLLSSWNARSLSAFSPRDGPQLGARLPLSAVASFGDRPLAEASVPLAPLLPPAGGVAPPVDGANFPSIGVELSPSRGGGSPPPTDSGGNSPPPRSGSWGDGEGWRGQLLPDGGMLRVAAPMEGGMGGQPGGPPSMLVPVADSSSRSPLSMSAVPQGGGSWEQQQPHPQPHQQPQLLLQPHQLSQPQPQFLLQPQEQAQPQTHQQPQSLPHPHQQPQSQQQRQPEQHPQQQPHQQQQPRPTPGTIAPSAPRSSDGLLEQQVRSSATQFADLPDMETTSRESTPTPTANSTRCSGEATQRVANAVPPSGNGNRERQSGGGGSKGSATRSPRMSPSASKSPLPQRSPSSLLPAGSRSSKATGAPLAVPAVARQASRPSSSGRAGGTGGADGSAPPSRPPPSPQAATVGATAPTTLTPGTATPIPTLPPGTSPDGDTRLCSPSGGPVLGVELAGKRAFQRSGLPVPHPASLALNPSQLPPDGVEVYTTPEGRSVCRIMRGCRLANGTAVLPRWMARFSGRLDKDCGVTSAIYMLTDVVKMEPDGAVRASSLFASRPRMDVNTKWADSDLFGLTETRTHFPHALSDILPRMVAVGVLLGGAPRVLRDHLRPPGAPAAPKGAPTVGFPAIRPALAVHPDTMTRNDSDWTKSFSHLLEHPLLRFEVLALSAAEHPATMLGSPTGTGVCFRSFITTNAPPYAYNSPLLNNPVLAASGVSHIDRFVLAHARAGPCTLRVTVINRRGPRALLGLPALRKALVGRAAAARVRLAYRVVEFEGLPLCAQAAIMQTTDVVISAHGAGNTNYIFLRPESVALEIFPFGYRAGPFDGFARALRLDYGEFFAAPQTRVFRECARRTNVSREIVNEWDVAVAAAAHAPATARHALRLEDGRYSTTARVCARMQELAFDVDAVAAAAIDRGVLQCTH